MRDECVRRGHHDHKSSNLQTSKPPSLQASKVTYPNLLLFTEYLPSTYWVLTEYLLVYTYILVWRLGGLDVWRFGGLEIYDLVDLFLHTRPSYDKVCTFSPYNFCASHYRDIHERVTPSVLVFYGIPPSLQASRHPSLQSYFSTYPTFTDYKKHLRRSPSL